MSGSSRTLLEGIFAETLAAVHAGQAVRRVVVADSEGALSIGGRDVPATAGVWIAAMGKAAVAMAEAFAGVAGDRVQGGLVITCDGHGDRLPGDLRLRFAGHPVPDSRGAEAAKELLDCVAELAEHDVLVVLLSGGASAMTSLPDEGLALSDLAEANRLMLACGADIHSINTVRKHCSRLAGGRLAKAASCRRIEVLAVSDVPGDSFSTIGSGPCAGDPTTYADALEVLDRFELRRRFPAELVRHFEAGKRGELPESPFPGDPALVGVHAEIVARNSAARAAAVAAARDRGERALDLGEVLAGEARVMGRRLAALARSLRCSTPTLLVAGGETVVRVTGGGRGGRSQELALAAALEWELEGRGGALAILAVGTDGADGPTDAAGAYVDAESPLRGTASTRAAEQHLSDHDSYGYFEKAGGLLRTGPTGTNVMDLVLIRVGSAGGVIDGV